jgi:hypothetical protein
MYATKRAVITTFTLTTVGVTTYLLSNKDKRKQLLERIKNIYHQYTTAKKDHYESRVLDKAGHPHPHDIDDNNMVSEGAMYSVNYYNERKDN